MFESARETEAAYYKINDGTAIARPTSRARVDRNCARNFTAELIPSYRLFAIKESLKSAFNRRL